MHPKSFALTGDSRQPKADVSNASFLMGDIGDVDDYGDPAYGDPSYGDPSFDGDIYEGDVFMNNAPLATYDTLIGDAAEQGGPRFSPRRMWQKLPRAGKIALGGAAALGVGFGAVKGVQAIQKAVARNKARKEQQRLNEAYKRSLHKGSITNTMYAQGRLPKVRPTQPTSFIAVQGAAIQSFPISPSETFVYKQLTWALDQQANTTPFLSDVVNATQPSGAGTPYITNMPGPVAGRYFPGFIITIGGNWLNSQPGINFSVTATIPLVGGGTLSIAAEPFIFTLGNKFDCRIMIFPWTLVAAKPVYTTGFYTAANPLIVNVSGSIPSAAVSVTIPGTRHPWTVGMRNSGI